MYLRINLSLLIYFADDLKKKNHETYKIECFTQRKNEFLLLLLRKKKKKMNSNKQYDDLYIIMIDIDQIFILHSQLNEYVLIAIKSCCEFHVTVADRLMFIVMM